MSYYEPEIDDYETLSPENLMRMEQGLDMIEDDREAMQSNLKSVSSYFSEVRKQAKLKQDSAPKDVDENLEDDIQFIISRVNYYRSQEVSTAEDKQLLEVESLVESAVCAPTGSLGRVAIDRAIVRVARIEEGREGFVDTEWEEGPPVELYRSDARPLCPKTPENLFERVAKIDDEEAANLRDYLELRLSEDMSGLPLVQLGNISEQSLPKIDDSYKIAPKHDGMRGMLVAYCRGVYLLDQKLNVWSIVSARNDMIDNFIVDVELVEKGGEVFIIMLDCLYKDGKDLRSQPFSVRLDNLKAGKQKYATYLPSFLKVQTYRPLTGLENMLKSNEMDGCDGVVFVPEYVHYKTGFVKEMFKWKPKEKMTVDYFVGVAKYRPFSVALYSYHESGKNIPEHFVKDMRFLWCDGKVVECIERDDVVPVKIRPDKDRANADWVVSTLRFLVQSPVTEDRLISYFREKVVLPKIEVLRFVLVLARNYEGQVLAKLRGIGASSQKLDSGVYLVFLPRSKHGLVSKWPGVVSIVPEDKYIPKQESACEKGSLKLIPAIEKFLTENPGVGNMVVRKKMHSLGFVFNKNQLNKILHENFNSIRDPDNAAYKKWFNRRDMDFSVDNRKKRERDVREQAAAWKDAASILKKSGLPVPNPRKVIEGFDADVYPAPWN